MPMNYDLRQSVEVGLGNKCTIYGMNTAHFIFRVFLKSRNEAIRRGVLNRVKKGYYRLQVL